VSHTPELQAEIARTIASCVERFELSGTRERCGRTSCTAGPGGQRTPVPLTVREAADWSLLVVIGGHSYILCPTCTAWR
jgi:hypothetical protein